MKRQVYYPEGDICFMLPEAGEVFTASLFLWKNRKVLFSVCSGGADTYKSHTENTKSEEVYRYILSLTAHERRNVYVTDLCKQPHFFL